MSEHAPYEVEYRVVWPDGSVHWVASRGVFQYDAEGRPQCMLGVTMHITERQSRMEDTLREAKTAAEAANEAKSRFLANMSRE